MSGFEDRFAYAVEVARLRDGLQGTCDELRQTSSTDALEDVLSERAKKDMMSRFKVRGPIDVEIYNNAWAEAYLAQVERSEAPREENMDTVINKLFENGGKRYRWSAKEKP